MNSELVELLVKLVLGSAGIMAVIALASIVTPKIAKMIIKRHPKWAEDPERVDDDKADGEPAVKDPYDAQKEKYDLNYKIYNEDIYGVDFKHVKKRKNG